MAWIAAHWLLIAIVWGVLHGAAQGVALSWPPTSTLARLAHAWSAINPFDWVKLAAQLQPPPATMLNAVEAAAKTLEGPKP